MAIKFHQSRANDFIINYSEQSFKESIDDDGNVRYETQEVQALFFSQYSFELYGDSQLSNPACFYVIKAKSPDYRRLRMWYPLSDIDKGTHIFKVLLEWNKDIVSIQGQDIGEGMAAIREIIIGNGDTSEYTRVDFETFSNEGKILKSFIDVSIGKGARIFDIKRKCWFIESSVIDPLLQGIRVLISQGTLPGYKIEDQRETIEAFDDFFNNPKAGQLAPPKNKAVLIADFIECLQLAKLDHALVMSAKDASAAVMKPLYRKAALALHPDRNNGDGSKMSELNKVWAELQAYL